MRGSVRGVLGNRYPYRDLYIKEMGADPVASERGYQIGP